MQVTYFLPMERTLQVFKFGGFPHTGSTIPLSELGLRNSLWNGAESNGLDFARPKDEKEFPFHLPMVQGLC